MQSHCSIHCAIEDVKNNPKIVKKVERDSFNSWKKEVKEKHKTHGDYESLLQDNINLIVRLIDYGHPCISHDGMCKKENAGHYHAIGGNNSIRFHLFNNWKQCEHCNSYQSSNRSGYDKGLKALFGFDFWLYVNEGIVRDYPYIKLSIPELKEKIAIARQIIKELESDKQVYSVQERIDLRRRYNERIGVYTK